LLSLEDVGCLAGCGDQLVLEVVDEMASHIGIAGANLVNILNPRLLILGGSVPQAIPALVPRIEAVVRRRALPGAAAILGVVPSRPGSYAVPIGAAAFVLGSLSVWLGRGVRRRPARARDGAPACGQAAGPGRNGPATHFWGRR
jgi:predicted NBD/HSP70 family sugar kinase